MAGRFQLGPDPIPDVAGVGLRHVHFADWLESRPLTGWLEAHSENFFSDGGRPLAVLEALRRDYPLSLHGVGLGLGSVDPFDEWHLQQLRALCDRFQPALLSEHLCWNRVDGRHLNDLLPLPYTWQAMHHVEQRIARVQDHLGRPLLIENLSAYVQWVGADLSEWDFLAELAARSGCGILLDLNNIHVNAINLGFDAADYLAAMKPDHVAEYHLAGYELVDGLLLDTHGAAVHEPVWRLYRQALEAIGPRPTLIEWDTNIPPLPVLLAEAEKAEVLRLALAA